MPEYHSCYTFSEVSYHPLLPTQPLILFDRPEDWGDPRWYYHYCKIEVQIRGEKYIRHCHLWQEVERDTLLACQVVAPHFFSIVAPTQPRELCDRSHLSPHDFWDDDWGERPPIYYRESILPEYDSKKTEWLESMPPGGCIYCWRVWHPEPGKNEATEVPKYNPFPNPPFPTALYFYAITLDVRGNYSVRTQNDELHLGFLFGTYLPEDQELAPDWIEQGWHIERQPSTQKAPDFDSTL